MGSIKPNPSIPYPNPTQVQKVTDDPNVYVKRLVPGTAANHAI